MRVLTDAQGCVDQSREVSKRLRLAEAETAQLAAHGERVAAMVDEYEKENDDGEEEEAPAGKRVRAEDPAAAKDL